MTYKVKNLNGTTDRLPYGYASWLDFWEKKTNQKATECHAIDCKAKRDLVGAHVKKVGSSDNSWYIVPLCSGCNQRTDEFTVEGPLVPVN